MDPKEERQKLSTSEIASDVVKIDVGEAMKKQNDVSMFLAEKVISAVLTMVAATSEKETLRSFIISFLRSSSIDELNAVYREIANTVLIDESGNGGPKISAVNGVWMEQSLSINPSSKDLVENFFKAAFAQVDFRFKSEQVRMEVNSWASRHTNDLIKDILPPGSVTRNTDWIYGNALYFKGAWKHKFPKYLTRDEEFHRLNDTSVSVSFMRGSKKQYVSEYDDFKVLKLPLRQGSDINRQFSMYFYLPDDKAGLDTLVKRMASNPGFLDSHIPNQEVQLGKFRIPKFKIEFGFEASRAFKELDSVSLYHKALVEIDEDGAEVVAVFARCSNGLGHDSVKKIDFVADHPFLFLIREDKTGTVLFVGQIFDPSKPSDQI